MTTIGVLLGVLVVGFAAFASFARWERQGNTVRAIAVIAGAVVLDAASGPGFDRGTGILHPQFGGLTFRLPDVLIVIALLARLVARGLPRRVSTGMLWWAAFGLWYATSGVLGLLAGNDSTSIFFEAKLLIYLVGGFALAAGAAPQQLIELMPRLVRFAAVVGAAVFVLDQAGVSITAALPLVPLDHFGEMGGDAATVFVSFGVLALTGAAVDTEHRRVYLLSAAPLLAAPFATDQRAALIDLAAAVAVLVLAWLVPRVRRQVRTTTTELVLLILVVVAAIVAPAATTSATQQVPFKIPLSDQLQSAFDNQAKIQSAQSRSNQWLVARGLVQERPVLGWGLGKKYLHYEKGPDAVISTDITHDIALDILLRAGAVGLVLVLVAIWRTAVGAWRRLPDMDSRATGLAIGGFAAVVGILGKGAVESILEKYLVATILGLTLGTVRCMTTGAGQTAERALAADELGSTWS